MIITGLSSSSIHIIKIFPYTYNLTLYFSTKKKILILIFFSLFSIFNFFLASIFFIFTSFLLYMSEIHLAVMINYETLVIEGMSICIYIEGTKDEDKGDGSWGGADAKYSACGAKTGSSLFVQAPFCPLPTHYHTIYIHIFIRLPDVYYNCPHAHVDRVFAAEYHREMPRYKTASWRADSSFCSSILSCIGIYLHITRI